MVNVSRGGGISNPNKLLPGATLFIRVQRMLIPGTADPCPDAIRTAALGEVKWCREVGNGQVLHFGVGFRYHIPV
jgi:hypothetical protein